MGDAGHKGNGVGLAVEVTDGAWLSALLHWRLHVRPGDNICPVLGVCWSLSHDCSWGAGSEGTVGRHGRR